MEYNTDYWNNEEFYKTFEIKKVLHMHEASYKTSGLAVYEAYPKILPGILFKIEDVILKICNSKWFLIPMFCFWPDDSTGYSYDIERILDRYTLYYAEDDTREGALMRLCVMIQEDVNIKPYIQEIFQPSA